jgi:hypothetical protein
MDLHGADIDTEPCEAAAIGPDGPRLRPVLRRLRTHTTQVILKRTCSRIL